MKYVISAGLLPQKVRAIFSHVDYIDVHSITFTGCERERLQPAARNLESTATVDAAEVVYKTEGAVQMEAPRGLNG